jgi:hypothetical protein
VLSGIYFYFKSFQKKSWDADNRVLVQGHEANQKLACSRGISMRPGA